jgi:Zn-dependent protease with chaperone function
MAVAALAGILSAPAQAFLSRHVEARADAHALALTGDPAAFEAMQRRLAGVNLADPDPNRFEYLYFASHPSTVERMAAARAYARGER